MHFSLPSSLLLSVALSSFYATAAPSQQKRHVGADFNKALGWPEPDFDYYTAAGNALKQAAQTGKLVAQPACNIQAAKMPQAPIPLPPPSEGLVLSHVAVGRGTQNYTCAKGGDPNAAPVANGAMASLFNVSCMATNYPQLVTLMPNVSVRYPVPTSDNKLAPANSLLSGHHFFTDATTAFFNMITPGANYGTIAAAKLNTTAAPDAARSVPWLKLKAKDGDWSFVEVYRVNTAGGQPPKTCQGQQENIEVDYAAEYWLWAPPA